ncbi:MAG: pilus assembly protein PilM [Verrucomicrobiota bacterium]
MKQPTSDSLITLFPAPQGWLARSDADTCIGASVTELCAQLPQRMQTALLLPSSAVITERLHLPQAPREDLLAMAQLQLEKLLPYTAEDFVFDLEELESTPDGISVLASAVPLSELRACGEPLRAAGLAPAAVGIYAIQLARTLPGKGVSLALWIECGKPFLLLASDCKLLWLENIATEDAVPQAGDISRALLGADLAGAIPGAVERVACCPDLWRDAVEQVLPGIRIEPGALEPSDSISGNWLPSTWAEEAAAITRGNTLKERLQWVATAYLALVAAAFCWLAFEKSHLGKLDRQIAELKPVVDLANARQLQWRSLEAAIDPAHYLVEVLHQAAKTVNGADIRITEFQLNPKEFAFSGEAANVSEAIEYVARLKKEAELAAYKLDSPNPNILPNERAQFRVTGKTDNTSAKR